ncbi:unnamed protein product [Sphenostylis stenocarpa]|uniref:Uncharacterized protein n=1 Tax=Sphenostylis stenocarpa TaxID=92480 RepID=A0AA86SB33_9FABA|nr:unnamed protein product [Sphenostylis stenocarpa]
MGIVGHWTLNPPENEMKLMTNNLSANLIFIFKIDYMMGSSIFLLCCLLIFSLYSLSQHTGYSLDATAIRKLSMPAPLHDHKTQVRYAPN